MPRLKNPPAAITLRPNSLMHLAKSSEQHLMWSNAWMAQQIYRDRNAQIGEVLDIWPSRGTSMNVIVGKDGLHFHMIAHFISSDYITYDRYEKRSRKSRR